MITFLIKLIIALALFAAIPHEYIIAYANFLSPFHAETLNLLSPLIDAIKNIVQGTPTATTAP